MIGCFDEKRICQTVCICIPATYDILKSEDAIAYMKQIKVLAYKIAKNCLEASNKSKDVSISVTACLLQGNVDITHLEIHRSLERVNLLNMIEGDGNNINKTLSTQKAIISYANFRNTLGDYKILQPKIILLTPITLNKFGMEELMENFAHDNFDLKILNLMGGYPKSNTTVGELLDTEALLKEKKL